VNRHTEMRLGTYDSKKKLEHLIIQNGLIENKIVLFCSLYSLKHTFKTLESKRHGVQSKVVK
jgi:hypothetical protein